VDVVERLTLEAASEETLLATEHRHRYELAAELVAGKRVLDLCCGSGYGTEILAGAGCEVVGVDNDMATIDLARVTVGERTGAEFEAADALAYLRGVDAGRFDAIVCFEGLEHLPDVEAVLARLRELAEDGVREVLSIPNSRLFEEDNPFHLTDFGYEEARAAFAEFPATVMVPQFLAEGSLIVAPDPPQDTDGGDPEQPEPALWLEDRREPEYANHFIFCVNCDAGTLASRDRGRLRLEAAPVYNRYIRSLEQTVQELWRVNNQLTRLRLGTSGSAAASYLAKLERAKDEYTEDVRNWIGRSRLAEARIVELERELAEAKAALRAEGRLPGKLGRKLR
jgi:2-polyprenyl-3-methyl-5-hydroxy-6-metoxy-1,4-benzoquinol methylase